MKNRLSKVGQVALRLQHHRLDESAAAQVSPDENAVPQIGLRQVAVLQLDIAEVALDNRGFPEAGSAHLTTAEVARLQAGVVHGHAVESAALQLALADPSMGSIRLSETHVGVKVAAG